MIRKDPQRAEGAVMATSLAAALGFRIVDRRRFDRQAYRLRLSLAPSPRHQPCLPLMEDPMPTPEHLKDEENDARYRDELHALATSPDAIAQAITAFGEAQFACGEWNGDAAESYEAVLARAGAAERHLRALIPPPALESLRKSLRLYDAVHAALSYMKVTSNASHKAHDDALDAATALLEEIAAALGVPPRDPRAGSIVVRDRIGIALARQSPDWDPTLPCACRGAEPVLDGVCRTCGRIVSGCGS